MEQTPIFALLLLVLLLGFASITVDASSILADYGHCEANVKQWASSSLHSNFKEDKDILRDLLFFLHVPRTGGRTYFHCFLRKLYGTSLECPRSYDKLRFDPSKSDCRLLVTHDDYSMISKLPQERTSVVTILRNPVDRVFSTYEFSIEVAARFLVHPNLTSVAKMSASMRKKTGGVSTLDIWPWKYLVPWMREDLFARRDARRKRGPTYFKSNDSYDMKEIVMPLHDYINDPIALDIIHNGATFQIAGLTNNSYIREAHEVRYCVLKYPTLGKYVLEVAKKRLDDMLYVGLTEDHRESATMFANVVGAQVISQLASTTVNVSASNNSVHSFSDSIPETFRPQSSILDNKSTQSLSTENIEAMNGNMTVDKLMEAYGTCISGLRKSQSQRRTASLKRLSPANFSKEARRRVSESVLKEITSLNSLDVELYKYALDHFAKQNRIMKQKLADSIVTEMPQQRIFMDAYSTLSWKSVSISMFTLLLLFIFLFVNARKRTSKLKI